MGKIQHNCYVIHNVSYVSHSMIFQKDLIQIFRVYAEFDSGKKYTSVIYPDYISAKQNAEGLNEHNVQVNNNVRFDVESVFVKKEKQQI